MSWIAEDFYFWGGIVKGLTARGKEKLKFLNGVLALPPITTEGEPVLSIGKNAFLDCPEIRSLDLSRCASLEIIDTAAFQNSEIVNVNIPRDSQLKEIGDFAFQHSRLDSFDFSKLANLKYIGSHSFYYSKFSSLVFPSALAYISTSAFQYSSLTYIDLSETSLQPDTIKENAFGNCSSCCIVKDNEHNCLVSDRAFPPTVSGLNQSIRKTTEIINNQNFFNKYVDSSE